MSIAIMTRVWATSPRRGVELLIELAIADFADDQGRCWPAIETIAAKARCSERYVQQTIRTLQSKESLLIEDGAGPYGTNLFTLLNIRVNGVHPGVNSTTEGGEFQRTGGVNSEAGFVSQNAPDPSSDPSREDPSIDPPRASARETSAVAEALENRRRRREAQERRRRNASQ